MKATVDTVIEHMITRTSKAGKEYEAMKVQLELESGELVKVLSFDEVELGAVVDVEKNGDFWNIVKPKRGQAELTEIKEMLVSMDKKLNKLLVGAPEGLEFARAQNAKLKNQATVDEVFEPEDE